MKRRSARFVTRRLALNFNGAGGDNTKSVLKILLHNERSGCVLCSTPASDTLIFASSAIVSGYTLETLGAAE